MSKNAEDQRILGLATDATIRIALLAGLVAICLQIMWPFILPVIWGITIAVAVATPFNRFVDMVGGRRKRAAALLSVLTLTVLLVPTWLLLSSVTGSIIGFAETLSEGTLQIPGPPEQVAEWPVVGQEIDAAWTGAIANSDEFLKDAAPQLARVGSWLLSTAAGFAFGVLQFGFALVLAGVFLAMSAAGSRTADSVANRLVAGRGSELIQIATATIRSVAKGVIGVAFVQALLAWIGMAIAGVPAASTWALLIMILAVIQLPAAIVIGPVAFYVYSTSSTVVAIAFLVWAILVSVSDSILKPLFMGHGASSPMLVILIGSLGGMMAFGILGLFIGAVVLAVGYELFMAWIRGQADREAAGPDEENRVEVS